MVICYGGRHVCRPYEKTNFSALEITNLFTRWSSDVAKQTYTVLIVPDFPRKFEANIMVLVRIENDKVIIEEDTTDRPLWRELVRAGIPREQIILTYAGEKLPNNF